MRKFRNKPTVIDSITFHSKKEAARYASLKLLQKLGKIYELEVQPAYDIVINGIKICKVKLDFRYIDHMTREIIIEDVKGFDNPMSRIKRKLVEAQHCIKVKLV